MEIFPIIAFFAYTFGLGYTATSFAAWEKGFLEKLIMRIGIGLSAVVVLGTLLSLVRLPIDWRIILLIALIIPFRDLIKNNKGMLQQLKGFSPKIKKSELATIAVIVIFSLSLYMYASGAQKYPYLEDDDPWSHAKGITYVAMEKTVSKSPNTNFQYLNPYPPAYDMVLGIIRQTSSSLNWTMKFFNALIIAMSLPFFYFFAKSFSGSKGKALFATFVLASVPAYLSHFIWAPAIAMTLFMVAMYCLEMSGSRRWVMIAALATTALLLSHPTHIVKLGMLMLIYIAVKTLAGRKLANSHVKSFLAAAIMSVALWWNNVLEFKRVHVNVLIENPAAGAATQSSLPGKAWAIITKVFYKWSGTASRPYTFEDFFIAKGQGLINNPVGIGIAASMLAIIGFAWALVKVASAFKNRKISEKGNSYLLIILLWMAFTFLVVNNLTFNLPVGFYAFRAWMIMAIPIALISAEGLWGVLGLTERIKLEKNAMQILKVLIILAVVAGIFFTSAKQKYEINTSIWPPGAFWAANEEIAAYAWLKESLPLNEKVFAYAGDDQVLGMDKYSCAWCREVVDFRATAINRTADETYSWLKQNGYAYAIISARDARTYGADEANAKINQLASYGKFQPAFQNNGAVVFKVT